MLNTKAWNISHFSLWARIVSLFFQKRWICNHAIFIGKTSEFVSLERRYYTILEYRIELSEATRSSTWPTMAASWPPTHPSRCASSGSPTGTGAWPPTSLSSTSCGTIGCPATAGPPWPTRASHLGEFFGTMACWIPTNLLTVVSRAHPLGSVFAGVACS